MIMLKRVPLSLSKECCFGAAFLWATSRRLDESHVRDVQRAYLDDFKSTSNGVHGVAQQYRVSVFVSDLYKLTGDIPPLDIGRYLVLMNYVQFGNSATHAIGLEVTERDNCVFDSALYAGADAGWRRCEVRIGADFRGWLCAQLRQVSIDVAAVTVSFLKCLQ
jgi:hypothetical protein